MNEAAILIGTFITAIVPAFIATQQFEMKHWFDISVFWGIGVTLIVAGIIL